jgi:hypothetical protein
MPARQSHANNLKKWGAACTANASSSSSPFELTSGVFKSTLIANRQPSTSTLQTTRHQRFAMANFWDLPKPVRKKIYRLHLVQDAPIATQDFEIFCGRTHDHMRHSAGRNSKERRPKTKLMPNLLQADRKIEREASPIYFGENVFRLWTPLDISLWVDCLWLRHLNLIRSMILMRWVKIRGSRILHCRKYDAYFKRMACLRSLRCLTVMVDEKLLLHALLNTPHKINWHISLGYGPQINMKLLDVNGMASFGSIRGIRRLEFLTERSSDAQEPKELGSIEGGFLETTMRSEVMLPRAEQQ